MMTADTKVGKAIVVCFNILFWLSGVAIFALGVLLVTDGGRVLLFNLIKLEITGMPGGKPLALLYWLALALLGIGAFVCAAGVFGCCGALKESKCLLGLYCMFLLLILLSELTVGILALYFQSQLLDKLSSNLSVQLKSSYGMPGQDHFTQTLDYMQNTFQCCGVDSAMDYDNSTWRTKRYGGQDMFVPLTCCLLANSDARAFLNPVPRNRTLCQSQERSSQNIGRHGEGCLYKLRLWFRNESTLLTAVGLGVAGVEIIGLAAAIYLCRSLKNFKDDETIASSLPEEKIKK